MTSDLESDKWIPLVEFSVQKGISLSTLRRYIKANKIPWKLLEGRYLVADDGTFSSAGKTPTHEVRTSAQVANDDARVKQLEQSLNAANEEIAELKTLVAFYEEKWAQNSKK